MVDRRFSADAFELEREGGASDDEEANVEPEMQEPEGPESQSTQYGSEGDMDLFAAYAKQQDEMEEMDASESSNPTANATTAENLPVMSTQDLFAQFDNDPVVFPPTQPANNDPPPTTSNLGKRKSNETDFSSTSTVVEREAKKPKTDACSSESSVIQAVNSKESRTVNCNAALPEPYIVAHDRDVISKFQSGKRICLGVQLELARLISTGKLTTASVKENRQLLDDMMGKSNSDAAPTTEMVFCNTSTPHNSARSPWAELDEECQALEKNPLAGMGHTSDWFGGSVTLRAVYDSKTKKLVLKMPTLDTSSALKRRFGSWNFLRVKTEDNSKETLEFFLRPVVIWGMVFRALHASQDQGSSHVTMVCVDEAYTAGKIKKTLVRKGVAYQLWDFINFLNDLEVNKRQFIGKYAARFALYLSASTPGPLLEQDAIHEQEDHYSEPNENGERSNMTDGCGISTWSLHEQFLKRSKVQATAIQFRLRGGKGMTLCVHDKEWLGKTDSKEPLEDEPPSPELWLRDSQIKIKFPSGRLLDPLHLTLAVLNYSQMRVSVQLSPEVIINLESNKVPATYFESLARACVRQIVANFTTIDTDLGLFRIWDAVNNAEGITTMRDIRATGIMQRKWNQKDDEENDGGMYPPDPSSGYPSSLGEVVMELLDSGFSPMDCVFLREKIRLVAKAQLNRKKVDYHFEVEKSCAAYVVSDPFGVLGPNEIQIKASGPKFLRDTGYYAHEIIGDVVMTRNPCKIPTDARKFKATTHPKLATMTDVIVCSIQGKIRLLDMLGGGDYDGDRAIVFWDHNIVNSFQDADLKYMTPPPGFEDMFEKDTTSVADFLASVESLSTELKTVELQKHLVGELESISNVGRISVQHDHCIYVTGSYAHPDSVMVGHMFARVMDAKKSGERFKGNLKFQDPDCEHPQKPAWNKKEKKGAARPTTDIPLPNASNRAASKRKGPPFIMDRIVKVMQVEYEAGMKRLDKVLPKGGKCTGNETKQEAGEKANKRKKGRLFDPALMAPWADIRDNPIYANDRALIFAHVQKLHAQWLACNIKHATYEQDVLACSRRFREFDGFLKVVTPGSHLNRILASCAYSCFSEHSEAFAFRVAWKELTAIKAEVGEYKVCSRRFYDRFKLNGKFLKNLWCSATSQSHDKNLKRYSEGLAFISI